MGELLVTAPVHIPVIVWFAARVVHYLELHLLLLLNVGSVKLKVMELIIISLTFN